MEYFVVCLLKTVIVLDIIASTAGNGDAYVGFKRLGNYYISDHNGKSNEKIYFLSVNFRANWMDARSFCKSYGMDLVALESDHEAKYFTKACENNLRHFEDATLLGGVSVRESESERWYWISSNKNINYNIKWSNKLSDFGASPKCLTFVREPEGFAYSKTNCYSDNVHQFACQKLIVKLDNWTEIFGI
jgi:hypothetical protein